MLQNQNNKKLYKGSVQRCKIPSESFPTFKLDYQTTTINSFSTPTPFQWAIREKLIYSAQMDVLILGLELFCKSDHW